MYIYTHIYIYMHINIYNVDVYIYIYMYIYIYTYVCKYTHTHEFPDYFNWTLHLTRIIFFLNDIDIPSRLHGTYECVMSHMDTVCHVQNSHVTHEGVHLISLCVLRP